MSEQSTEPNAVTLGLTVVLGLGADGKAHASRFTPADSEQAVRAARLMNFHAVTVGGDLQTIANELPIGKIFVTGKGLVPFVKRELYDKLAVLIGTEAQVFDRSPAPSTGAEAKIALTTDALTGGVPGDKPADPWAAIGIGATVLAKSADSEEGWFEAIVASIAADGNELTLRWRDFTGEVVIKRQRRAVGLLA